jgi:beta-galactosidase
MRTIKCFAGSVSLILFLGITTSFPTRAQNQEIDISIPKLEIKSGHLDLGGKNLKGDQVGFNNYYMEWNGSPVIPGTGSDDNYLQIGNVWLEK